jgi:hypothetical protein
LIKAHSVHQMSAKDDPSEEKGPQVTASLLQRLLSTVENNTRSRRLEIASAVLLGLAATASAWCGYQSNLWTGVQTFSLVAADEAARKSTQLTLQATQLQSVDLQMLLAYVEAGGRGDQKLADFLHARFRPEARKALDADGGSRRSAPQRGCCCCSPPARPRSRSTALTRVPCSVS